MKRKSDDNIFEPVGKKACIEVADPAEVALKSVRPSDVPEYLRESEFYQSLDVEDNEEFNIPANLMKENMDVSTMQDASDLLHTIRFWGLDVTPQSLVHFALARSFKDIHPVFRVFDNEILLVKRLLCILNDKRLPEKRTEAAMQLGILEILHYLRKTGKARFTANTIALAAGGGHVACLKYALSNQNVYTYGKRRDIYKGAVANGQLECVEILDKSYLALDRNHLLYPPHSVNMHSSHYNLAHASSINLPAIAAGNDQLECLKFLHGKGCPLFECAESAAACGSLACLQYILKNLQANDGNTGLHVCKAAARNGHRHCLEYLLENNYPSHEILCTEAAKSQNEACLKCAHRHGCSMKEEVGIIAAGKGSRACLQYFFENGGERTFLVCHAAALHGHLNCLQYACERGCPIMPLTHSAAHKKQYLHHFRVSKGPAYLVEIAAARKHWGCVLYLILQGCPLTRGLTAQLACKHKDNLLQLAVERGCEVATEVGVRYAKSGDLEGLTVAMEHGCATVTQILCAAARKGHLHCLAYAHEQGCPWSEDVCVAAARGGHLDCLQYARDRGCPWDARVKLIAYNGGHDDLLQFALQNNCPDDEEEEEPTDAEEK